MKCLNSLRLFTFKWKISCENSGMSFLEFKVGVDCPSLSAHGTARHTMKGFSSPIAGLMKDIKRPLVVLMSYSNCSL